MTEILMAVLLVTSLVNVYGHWIEDGFIGRLLYMSTAFTCLCGLIRFVYIGAVLPESVTPVLLFLFAALSMRNVCARSARHIKHRKTIRHAKHQ